MYILPFSNKINCHISYLNLYVTIWEDKKLLIFFVFFRAAPTAYGSSQARGLIRAIVANLHHSSQQHQILDPLREARDRTLVLLDTSWAHYC